MGKWRRRSAEGELTGEASGMVVGLLAVSERVKRLSFGRSSGNYYLLEVGALDVSLVLLFTESFWSVEICSVGCARRCLRDLRCW